MTRLVRRSIEKPEDRRSRWDRFLVALTLGDSGRNGAQVAGCWHLHQIADLERELYGEIVSASARDHVEGTDAERDAMKRSPRPLLSPGCKRHWTSVSYH